MPRLFSANSKLTNVNTKYDLREKVTVRWFVAQRPERPAYLPALSRREPQADDGFKADDGFSREMLTDYYAIAVEEFFTEVEAQALEAYLTERGDYGAFGVSEQTLPLSYNPMPISCIGITSDEFYIPLHEDAGYNLPFQVQGHCYLHEHPNRDEIVIDIGEEDCDPFLCA